MDKAVNKKGPWMKGRYKRQAQIPTSKTPVEERTYFKHRELSQSEATLPPQGTGSSQQVPSLPAQGLCTVTAWPLESAQEMHSVCLSCF